MIAAALAPVFLLILAGAGLNRIDFPGRDYWPGIERLTYYLFFPALLVHRIALADLSSVPLIPLTSVLVGGVAVVSGLIWIVRHRLSVDAAGLTTVYQGSVRFNTFIGLAVASALFGEPGLSLAAVVIGLKIPLINIACVAAFSLILGRRTGVFRSMGRGLATNPLIVACLIGLGLNHSGIGLPGWSADLLSLLGRAALPLGLLAVGVALQPRRMTDGIQSMLMAAGMKFVLLPGVMLAMAAMLGLDPLIRAIVVLMACMPTASSGYILARELGGDATLMATAISAQSLLAFGVIPAWMWLLL
jgi:predicted permease